MFHDERDAEVESPPNLCGVTSARFCAQFGLIDTFENESDTLSTGEAFDVIIFKSADNQYFQNSEFQVYFNGRQANRPRNGGSVSDSRASAFASRIVMEIRRGESTTWIPIERLNRNRMQSDGTLKDDTSPHSSSDGSPSCTCCRLNMSKSILPFSPGLTIDGVESTKNEDECAISRALADFLLPGRNPVRYLLLGKRDKGKIVGVARANIFLWSYKDRFIVCDIDGTITKSNAVGIFDTLWTENYQQCHDGVCQLLTSLSHKTQARMIYVTSRPISLASATRRFLENLSQNRGSACLPHGPLLGFGGTFQQLLTMELFTKSTYQFKSGVLLNQVVKPYLRASSSSTSTMNKCAETPMFRAGFGNTYMDVQAYHMAGIHLNNIFLINKQSALVVFDQASEKDGYAEGAEQCMSDVDSPKTRKWYEERVRSTFYGYTDVRLVDHVLGEATRF